MDETIILNVHIQAAPGKGPELRERLTALLGPSRNEPGCIRYLLHVDPENEDKLMFYEAFRDQAALDAHLEAHYFQDFLKYREASDPDPMAFATVTRWKPAE